MTDTASTSAPWGWAGFAVGAVALLAAVGLFWAGPFAAQQEVAVSLGELAADVATSAARKVAGVEAPAPQPIPRDIDDYLDIATGAAGVLAILLAAFAFVRHEAPRPAIAAGVLGGLAIAFQFLAFYAMALLGTLVLMSLIYAMRDAFSDIFGGIFGG